MLIVLDPLPADCVAELQSPDDMPPGAVFQTVDMQTALEGQGGYRITASLTLTGDPASTEIADWLWPLIEEAAPVTATIGGVRARLGEPAALAWMLDRARGRG